MFHIDFLFPMLCYMKISKGMKMPNTEDIFVSPAALLHTNSPIAPFFCISTLHKNLFQQQSNYKNCHFFVVFQKCHKI